jgi:chromosome segregation ATPase
MEIEWLDDLETRVHEAAARLQELKGRNGELESRVAELEAQLAASPAPAGWEGERDSIRRRVEKLASTLEDLLEE